MAQHTPECRRKSVFSEVGLTDDVADHAVSAPSPSCRPTLRVRFRSKPDVIHFSREDDYTAREASPPSLRSLMAVPTASRLHRMAVLVFIFAFALPLIHFPSLLGLQHVPFGARGGVIRPRDITMGLDLDQTASLFKRQETETNVCKRWSQQTAIVNGTLYSVAGRATRDASQQSDTWNNDFLTLDLKRTWQISAPSFTGLPRPDDVPAVSLGYLWNSHKSLFLYGGEFSDNPPIAPTPFSLWEYDILASRWIEHENPRTSAGINAEGDGQEVQRSAEGAGVNIPTMGRGYYFGGHLDTFTTPGWSQTIDRVYLKSLLEYTFPGATNTAVESLGENESAGEEGVWRNITEGGLQDEAGFTERADGILVYVPGFGTEGILLGLAGGTNETFTQMNVIDVYDISTSTWFKQATSGRAPDIRVNPCAVVAAAPDGSSYNVYIFGGQNLVPFGEQIQYDDMWILSVPSFNWIEVDMSSQAVPPARAGHTCNIWDGQMIVVGGYVGQDLSCDSPGVYVFNLTSLEWTNQFTSLTGDGGASRSGGDNGDSGDSEDGEGEGDNSENPFSQHPGQRGGEDNQRAGLEGSYGYRVPEQVIRVIGGNPIGGATITAPVQTATAGPLATGKPITYTVTGPDGAIVTQTVDGPASGSGDSGPNIGAIVAGTIAGVLGLLVLYFAFCAWVYRKQLKLYKNHVAMAQRAAADGSRREKDGVVGAGLLFPSSGGESSDRNRGRSEDPKTSTETGGAAGSSSGGAAAGYRRLGRRSSDESSFDDDLLATQEPTFWGSRGVLLNPRRSLRVINRD